MRFEAKAASEPRPGVFLDLNGTLVLPVTPEALGEYQPMACAAEAVALLCRVGLVCPVVTVQSKIGKGMFTEAEFRNWFEGFRAQLSTGEAFLEGPYVCPHRYASPCGCKKPAGALYRRAAADLGLDLSKSFVVGDSLEDMEAAQVLGCQGVLVRTGWPVVPNVERRSSHIAHDVLGASHWIVAALAAAGEPRR